MDETGNIPAENPQDVKQSANELVDKHRKVRSDKGQPRKGKTAGTKADPVPTATIDPSLQINIDLVKDATKALIGAVDSMVCRKVYSKANRLGADKNLAMEYAQQTGMTKDEARVISECSAAIMARSDFLLRHAPEVMLAVVATSYTVRVITTLKRLDELEEKMKKAHRVNSPAPPVVDANESSAPK